MVLDTAGVGQTGLEDIDWQKARTVATNGVRVKSHQVFAFFTESCAFTLSVVRFIEPV